MAKIAMITPWPDQKTGIADYAYDLVQGLRDCGAQVEVFTSARPRARILEGVRVAPLGEYSGAGNFDTTVYQMGNCSEFHVEMLPILAENPGVVHLHDTILHHLVAFALYREDFEAYYGVLKCWYQDTEVERVRSHNMTQPECFWDGTNVMDIPFFEPVLQYATHCIVHSQFARKLLRKRLPALATSCIAQMYRGLAPVDRPANEKLMIGIFGLVQKHKHVDLVFDVLKDLRKDIGDRFHLNVCGALDRGCEDLGEVLQELELSDCVTLRGRVTEAEFDAEMKRADLCISLRSPTMGETSAVVSRAMQIGLPTIVNDIGWYAELPSCVHKLPTGRDAMRAKLLGELHSCFRSQEFYAWKKETRQMAESTFDYDSTIRDYLCLLN